MGQSAWRIRRRTDADLRDLEVLARAVHALDGYPPQPAEPNFAAFLASTDALSAWVVEVDSGVGGHVALHTRSSDAVMALATEALRVNASDLAVVARLLVAPELRGVGVGRALLDTAAAEAGRLRRVAILDVGVRLTKAVTLYESAGWNRLGHVRVTFRSGVTFDEYVYCEPRDRQDMGIGP